MIKIRHRSTCARLHVLNVRTLTGADFHCLVLSGADLAGAQLRDSNLRHISMRAGNLRKAGLSGADPAGADPGAVVIRTSAIPSAGCNCGVRVFHP